MLVAADTIPANAQAAAGAGLKLKSFSARGGSPARVGAVATGGAIVDYTAEAAKRGATLSFDPGSMISQAAGGGKALAEVRACRCARSGREGASTRVR